MIVHIRLRPPNPTLRAYHRARKEAQVPAAGAEASGDHVQDRIPRRPNGHA